MPYKQFFMNFGWAEALQHSNFAAKELKKLTHPVESCLNSNYTLEQAFITLFKWLPFVLGTGFIMNLLISFFTMLIGTFAGSFSG